MNHSKREYKSNTRSSTTETCSTRRVLGKEIQERRYSDMHDTHLPKSKKKIEKYKYQYLYCNITEVTKQLEVIQIKIP